MINNFFSRFLILAALAVPTSASALDLPSLAGHELPAAASVPAPSAPVKASPKPCRPFLLSVSVGGVSETVSVMRACTPENEPVWQLSVRLRGNNEISVSVSSEDYPEAKAKMESRIKSMALEGVSREDAEFIVMKTGPALKLAAAAAPEKQEEILAGAEEALAAHLARP